jgi:cytochrome c oxidase subunit 2
MMTLPSMPSTLLALQDVYKAPAHPPAPRDGVGGADFFMPPDYGNFGANVDWPFWVITWICIFFFVLIVVIMAWFMWKYNRDLGAKFDGTAVTHNTPIEIIWSGIPLILVIYMFYVGFEGYMDMVVPPKDAYQVTVTARKWNWAFEYPNGYIGDELHVWAEQFEGDPDANFKMLMKSEDVLHAFFVPHFRVKQDIVPGKYSLVWFRAKHSGTTAAPEAHHLFCAEFCGTDHSNMHAWVYVHPDRASFDRWMAQATDTTDWPLEVLGDRLYQTRGCAGCHLLDGGIKIGPPLNNTWAEVEGGRRQFDKGEPLDTSDPAFVENYIRNSVVNPLDHIVASFPSSMPTYKSQMKERDLDAIVAFIKWLRDNQGPPYPYETFMAAQKAAGGS